jgi:hypothetical protein
MPDFEGEGYLAAETLDSMMHGKGPDSCVLLADIKEVVRRESTCELSSAGRLVQKAVVYIDRHALEGIGVEDVVRHLGCSRRLADLRFREFMCRDAQRSSEAASDIWEKRWLDRQANRFASYLLMPKPIVEKLYSLYWQKWFGRGEATPMVVERNPYWNTDFQNVVDPIARKMGVSSEAMLIRLVDLGLLVEVQVYE